MSAPFDSEDEFPHGPFPLPQEEDGILRRTVLKGAGAAAALTALGACFRQPEREMLPYSKRPELVRPGIPLHFATCTPLGGYAVGLLVESREGHPQKIEGNPEHPWSLGATGPLEQAELLRLYDRHRLRTYWQDGKAISRQTALEALVALAEEAREDEGAGLRILAEPSGSPLIQALHARILQRFPQARVVHWAAVSEEEAQAGAQEAFGQPVSAVPNLLQADVVLAFDADVLAIFPGNVRHARELTARRVPEVDLTRLYVAETALTVTGMFADHRVALRPTELEAFAIAVLHALVEAGGPAELGYLVEGVPRPELDERAWRMARAVALDLLAHRGRSVVITGPRQPARIHAVAHAINHALGNVGRTIRYHPPVLPVGDTGPTALRRLIEEIDRGEVDTVVITAWNPVYTAPGDLPLAAALRRARRTVYATLRPDQTSEVCNLLIPGVHFLETWGDGRAPDGFVGFIQPLIQPLFEGMSEVDLLATLVGAPEQDAYELLFDYWASTVGRPADFAARFREWIRLGLIPNSGQPELDLAPRWEALRTLVQRWRPQPPRGLEASFAPDYSVYDGRYAWNAWLQELPDPVTKIVWDNAAYLGPKTAQRLELGPGEVVRLRLGEREVEAPVWIVPGHAEGAVTLPLGYGLPGLATEVGERSVEPPIGFNFYPLRRSEALWSAPGLTLERLGTQYRLVQSQEISDMRGRELALSRTVREWEPLKMPMADLRGPVPKLYDPWQYEDAPHKWAMTVDLTRCTGCSACVVACQAENNIPAVGREQVRLGREMHWLRIDRYFLGDEHAPAAITQPLLCVHCENAPCEYVCPVNATVHSDEGLNEMIYNRCIGTRYCSNNCPYKVRRFNYFDYTQNIGPLETLYKNPQVTVRARGVMEKCTYCVQRIERSRINARVRGVPIRDGELQTACQQVCPTQAIVFGDLHDPTAQVTLLHEDPRAYELLHHLGTRPRTRHLVRITNPNPELG